MINLLYIHGFNSSPQSYKAELTKAFLVTEQAKINYICPQLAIRPASAIAQLNRLIQARSDDTWYIIGSSLGGYYASYLAEKYQLKAVLVNPAVKPYELLMDHLGEQENYHTGERVNIEASFMDELKVIEQTHLTKKNYRVMLQTDDEVLDYQQAEKKYQGCQLVIEQGGDHSFINFQAHLPDIMRFFIAG